MNYKCFALRARGICGALNGNYPGYTAYAFHKPEHQ